MSYVEEVIQKLDKQLPGLDRDLLRLYALLVFVEGPTVTLKDVHDAWAIWKNETKPGHQSLIPFDMLTEEVQELDRKYAEAIVRVAVDTEDWYC